jgi:hypothetical protein
MDTRTTLGSFADGCNGGAADASGQQPASKAASSIAAQKLAGLGARLKAAKAPALRRSPAAACCDNALIEASSLLRLRNPLSGETGPPRRSRNKPARGAKRQ